MTKQKQDQKQSKQYFAPLVGAFKAIKAEHELTSQGGTQAFMKSSVEISVKPTRNRKLRQRN